MKVAGFIANRIAFNRSAGVGGQKPFSRFIIRLSIVATVISVAVMIVTLSFANGFQATVSQKVFSFLGHIRIQDNREPDKSIIAEESPITRNDELAEQIRNHPQVASIHPYSTKYGILKANDEIDGVLFKGVDSTYDFDHIDPFIRKGKHITFKENSFSRDVMLSANTASSLKVNAEDSVLVLFIKPDGDIKRYKLRVTGIYKTGIEDYDKTFAIVDLKLLQQLKRDTVGEDSYKYEIGGYEIFLKDYHLIRQVSDEIHDMDDFPATWSPISVKRISPNIFDWLNMQDNTRNVLIGIMIIVALINLVTCLIVLVLERVRMVGVLKALGATDWTVQKIFLRHSAFITITGIIIGTILALGILFLQKETGFIKLREEAYYMSEAAVKIVWWQIGVIAIGTLLVCFLVLMIPSLFVKRIQPVKAIQFR